MTPSTGFAAPIASPDPTGQSGVRPIASEGEPVLNYLCPCGSGRKWKHCHGTPLARPQGPASP